MTTTTQTKMHAYLTSLGLTDLSLNESLTAINQRPVFNAADAAAALVILKNALRDCEYSKYSANHGVEHVFRVKGCGTVKINVHRAYPTMQAPIFVTPFAVF